MYAVKLMTPSQVLCPACKPAEAVRSKQRRIDAKHKEEAKLQEASASAAEEYYHTRASSGCLAAQVQPELATLVDTLVAIPRRPDLFDTIGAKYREIALPMGDMTREKETSFELWETMRTRARPHTHTATHTQTL